MRDKARRWIRRQLDKWECHRGRHDWETFGYVVVTHSTSWDPESGEALLQVGDQADVYPQRRCRRCPIGHPHNLGFKVDSWEIGKGDPADD